MIPLSEKDYLIKTTGKFTGTFKPPIDDIEYDIIRNEEDVFGLSNLDWKDKKQFNKCRKDLGEFFITIVVDLKVAEENIEENKIEEKELKVNNKTIKFIPFTALVEFISWYFQQYHLTLLELKN